MEIFERSFRVFGCGQLTATYKTVVRVNDVLHSYWLTFRSASQSQCLLIISILVFCWGLSENGAHYFNLCFHFLLLLGVCRFRGCFSSPFTEFASSLPNATIDV